MPTFLIYGDIHAPFHCKASITKSLKILEEMSPKPDFIITMGDFADCFNYSSFPRSLNVLGPQQEIVQARLFGEEFYKILKKKAPKAKIFQLTGNHESRIEKRLKEKCPELEALVDVGSVFKFKDVELVGYRDELVLNNILFTHGFLSQAGGAHARHYGTNCVVGHSHKPAISYVTQFGKETIFEMNVGHLSRPEDHLALQYSQTKYTKWSRALGLIDELGPRVVLL